MKKTFDRTVRLMAVMFAVLTLSVIAMPAKAQAEDAYQIFREDGQWYLKNATTGKTVTGIKGMAEVPAGSKTYYFFKNTDGSICRQIWIDSNGKRYRALRTGKLASGRTKVGRKFYYFKKTTRAMLSNVWKRCNGGYCRFGANGAQLFGLATVKGNTYYFDPNKFGIRATGTKVIDGKVYSFDERGRARKGFLKINGKTYYYNSQGVMVTGWMVDGGKKYYFNKSTGVMATGKVKIDGKTYDFGTRGYITATEDDVTGTWSIRVNKSTNVVTLYRGSTPVKAMLCSVGLNDATPSGTFLLQAPKTNWHPLFGGVYGQYCRTITGNILFHSVYYMGYRNVHTLATGEYVKLGQAASHGCVRLSAGDAYYIWTKVPTGTKVTIGYFGSTDPLPRPSLTPLNGKDYDPTDPILTD